MSNTTKGTKGNEITYCIPGDIIGSAKEYECGKNTHLSDRNQVVASCVGRLEITKDEKGGKVLFIMFNFLLFSLSLILLDLLIQTLYQL